MFFKLGLSMVKELQGHPQIPLHGDRSRRSTFSLNLDAEQRTNLFRALDGEEGGGSGGEGSWMMDEIKIDCKALYPTSSG